MLIDPVCGMHIDPEQAPEMYAYQDHTYYFCSENCKQEFINDPKRYSARAKELNPEGYGDCKAA